MTPLTQWESDLKSGKSLSLVDLLTFVNLSMVNRAMCRRIQLFFNELDRSTHSLHPFKQNGFLEEIASTNNIKDAKTMFLFSSFAKRIDSNLLQQAIQNNIESVDAWKRTALFVVLEENNIDAAKMLLNCGANIRATGPEGENILMWVASNHGRRWEIKDKTKIIRKIYQQLSSKEIQAFLKCEDHLGKTALHLAEREVYAVLLSSFHNGAYDPDKSLYNKACQNLQALLSPTPTKLHLWMTKSPVNMTAFHYSMALNLGGSSWRGSYLSVFDTRQHRVYES